VTPRQRVAAALKKQPVDRVPIFMWFHPDTTRLLAELLEIPGAFVAQAMGNDVAQTWVSNNYAMEGIVHDNDGEGHVDLWGIHWVKRHVFNQIEHFPLAESTREQVLNYPFPYEQLDFLLSLMQPVLGNRGDLFIGCDVSPCVFEMYWRLRGMEMAMLDMAEDRELADEMFRRCADFSIALAEPACARMNLDWLWLGDDVSGQQSMMMSPKTWREQIKPHLARIAKVGKAHNLPVAYHCCGALRPIIADLIEIGIDVLNPIQCNCPGMDPFELKREFGAKLAFMGGVDTQGVLPSGTADDVRRATARLIEGMTADGGGFILAASHTIPPETPADNIFAMYEVAGLPRQEIFDRAALLRHARPSEADLID
jgi:uroporphyrinogen decarboxylase